jgi:hypothetical protein
LLHGASGQDSFGVLSIPGSPVLGSPFAIALFQAYIGHNVIAESFAGIQGGNERDSRSHRLLVVTHSNGETQINFRPKTPAARAQLERAIRVVGALLPFTPRSVIVQREKPLRAVEITSIGATNYSTSVHFLTGNDIPKAYALTPRLLDRMSWAVSELALATPKYRFAVTGESFMCLSQKGMRQDIDLFAPDTHLELPAVFGSTMSHLVFLIDEDQPQFPDCKQIPWIEISPRWLVRLRTISNEDVQRRELVRRLNGDGEKILCHYLCACDPQVILPDPLFIFEKGGLVMENGLCQECMELMIGEAVRVFFDISNQNIDQRQLSSLVERLDPIPTVDSTIDPMTAEAWPSVPLGMLIWTLCSSRQVSTFVKAWVTGTVDISARIGASSKTFCPNHPNIILPVPAALTTVQCGRCNFMFCRSCRTWHENTMNCESHPRGTRYCPFCQLAVVKTQACNDITCKCGNHWCYYCGCGYATARAIVVHMNESHHQYLDLDQTERLPVYM